MYPSRRCARLRDCGCTGLQAFNAFLNATNAVTGAVCEVAAADVDAVRGCLGLQAFSAFLDATNAVTGAVCEVAAADVDAVRGCGCGRGRCERLRDCGCLGLQAFSAFLNTADAVTGNLVHPISPRFSKKCVGL